MHSKCTYSKHAAGDVKKIYIDTVKRWGYAQANKYDAGLERTIESLADHPDMGRKCDEIKSGYQRFEYERHNIFYRKRQTDIFIIRILHNQMNAKRHL